MKGRVVVDRPGLMEIDVFLLSSRGWDLVVFNSKDTHPTPMTLSKGQIIL